MSDQQRHIFSAVPFLKAAIFNKKCVMLQIVRLQSIQETCTYGFGLGFKWTSPLTHMVTIKLVASFSEGEDKHQHVDHYCPGRYGNEIWICTEDPLQKHERPDEDLEVMETTYTHSGGRNILEKEVTAGHGSESRDILILITESVHSENLIHINFSSSVESLIVSEGQTIAFYPPFWNTFCPHGQSYKNAVLSFHKRFTLGLQFSKDTFSKKITYRNSFAKIKVGCWKNCPEHEIKIYAIEWVNNAFSLKKFSFIAVQYAPLSHVFIIHKTIRPRGKFLDTKLVKDTRYFTLEDKTLEDCGKYSGPGSSLNCSSFSLKRKDLFSWKQI